MSTFGCQRSTAPHAQQRAQRRGDRPRHAAPPAAPPATGGYAHVWPRWACAPPAHPRPHPLALPLRTDLTCPHSRPAIAKAVAGEHIHCGGNSGPSGLTW